MSHIVEKETENDKNLFIEKIQKLFVVKFQQNRIHTSSYKEMLRFFFRLIHIKKPFYCTVMTRNTWTVILLRIAKNKITLRQRSNEIWLYTVILPSRLDR